MLAHFSEPPPKLLGLSDYFRTAFRKNKKVEKRSIHNPYSRHRPRHFSRLGDHSDFDRDLNSCLSGIEWRETVYQWAWSNGWNPGAGPRLRCRPGHLRLGRLLPLRSVNTHAAGQHRRCALRRCLCLGRRNRSDQLELNYDQPGIFRNRFCLWNDH